MSKGLIFDIKEFAINDGPGIRVTVFMKGCPLRCLWCHNPEGMNGMPQLNNKTGKITGYEITSEKLAEKINKFKDVFDMSGGGVTFSGGEPTLQSEFVYDTAMKIKGVHKTLDTSGFCKPEVFQKLLTVFDLIYFDLKIIDEEKHRQFTGVSNADILENLSLLDKSGVPFHIRIPLIPNITDTKENLTNIKNIILNLKSKPLRVDPLPYNILAGGKYENYGMEYPLYNHNKQNNIGNIEQFKKELISNNIKIMGDEVKCLQNA